jgi:acylphosphatase
MTATVARLVVVSGDVQGVFFRDGMLREAARRDVTGWVRNRGDGTLQAHLEGEPDAVAAVVLWAREGPRHATVEELEVTTVEVAGFEAFRIR